MMMEADASGFSFMGSALYLSSKGRKYTPSLFGRKKARCISLALLIGPGKSTSRRKAGSHYLFICICRRKVGCLFYQGGKK